MKIRKGDTVVVTAGDDRGTRGTVHRVIPNDHRVVVSGVNLVKKHQRRTGDVRTQVGIIEREAPIDLCNVALVCPRCNAATRVGYRVMEGGSKVRVCRSCNETIE